MHKVKGGIGIELDLREGLVCYFVETAWNNVLYIYPSLGLNSES